jgi:methylmalonyl-CoA/ethylmalonyl-CoA epimerase
MDHIAFGSTDQDADADDLAAAGRSFSRTNTYIPVTGKTISDFTYPSGSRWQLSD